MAQDRLGRAHALVAAGRRYLTGTLSDLRVRVQAGHVPTTADRDPVVVLGPAPSAAKPGRLVANINALHHDFGADVGVDPIPVMTLVAAARRGLIRPQPCPTPDPNYERSDR
jgi:hypothetical protein